MLPARSLTFILLLLLGACTGREYGQTERREFVLERVNPPKHMLVDLRDAETGQVFRSVGVAKRCTAHAVRAVVGRTYRLESRSWRDSQGRSGREFTRLRNVFCG